jgi:hypothetical protein
MIYLLIEDVILLLQSDLEQIKKMGEVALKKMGEVR